MGDKFTRYPDLENYWNLEKIMEKYAPHFDRSSPQHWIVTEKIHGSNVCVSNTYKEGPAFFSRNGNQLPADYQTVLRKYDWEWLFTQYPGLKFVYGEIAGPKIRKGIDYGDECKLYIFDYFDGENFLRIPKFEKGFDYTPPLIEQVAIKETYNDMLYDIIAYLKSDPISIINPVEGNIAEGYVVKCLSMPMLTNETRFVFKVKHPKFDEKIKGAKKEKKFDDIDYSIVDEYINDNRVQSAISKYPGYRKHQIGDVMREIVSDVEKDMKKDGHRWDKKYAKRITKFAQTTVVGWAGKNIPSGF